jgi:crossover junction endodeoxyribonuclease RuvC
MKIIAIDPGYDRVGIAIMEKVSGKEVVLFSECFQTKKDLSIPNRILSIGQRLSGLMEKHQPNLFAIENLFFQNNQKTAMGVAEARGVMIYTAGIAKIPVVEFTPLQIKAAVTGHGKATKQEVFRMVEMILKLEDRKYIDDEIDAIAVGITAFAHLPSLKIHKENI